MKGKKIPMAILYLLVAGFVTIGFINLFRKEKDEMEHVQQNYIEVRAKVNRVMRSGNKHKQATLLQVEFIYENEKQRATIRRGGYKENTYNEGDSIVLYINPENKNDIK